MLRRTGIDVLLKNYSLLAEFKPKRVGLISNQSSLTQASSQSAYALQEALGESLVSLFSLEHGWTGTKGEGIEGTNEKDPATGLPVYSLYGILLQKNLERLKELDILLIDIQDVGMRCYTYASTCMQALEFLSEHYPTLQCYVCDRPNPLGNIAQGPPLRPGYRSLVGYCNVPYQHGMTIGALLSYFNKTLSSPITLSVIPSPSEFKPFKDQWVPPSPGLPDWESTLLYPGLVFLEAINCSEGRGTPYPFKCIVSPLLKKADIVNYLNAIPNSGIRAEHIEVQPKHGKFEGKPCHGALLSITDIRQVNGFRLGLHILSFLYRHMPDFEWVMSNEKYWIDLLTGGPDIREAIITNEAPDEILEKWKKGEPYSFFFKTENGESGVSPSLYSTGFESGATGKGSRFKESS